VLPEKSCSCNTLATLDVGEIDLHVAAAVLPDGLLALFEGRTGK